MLQVGDNSGVLFRNWVNLSYFMFLDFNILFRKWDYFYDYFITNFTILHNVILQLWYHLVAGIRICILRELPFNI